MATPQSDETYAARCGIPDAIVWCQQCDLAYCRMVSYISMYYGCHVLFVVGKFLLGTGAAGTDYFCATCFLSSHKPEPKWLKPVFRSSNCHGGSAALPWPSSSVN